MSVSTSVGPGAASSSLYRVHLAQARLYWDCGVEACQQNPLTVIVLQAQNCLHSLLVDLVEDEKVYFHSLTVNRLERAPIRVALHDLSHAPAHHRPIVKN